MAVIGVQEGVIRGLLCFNLLVYAFNACFGSYIVARMMVPQKVRFFLLWLFYVVSITLCLFEIALMTYLLVYPAQIEDCYIYGRSPASIIHCIVCSLIVACGYIAIATMTQIRLSLQVILKEITKDEALKRLRAFMALYVTIWSMNQVGSVVILFYYFN